MKQFFAQRAWVNGQWQDNVRLTVDLNGYWHDVAPGVMALPDDDRLDTVLPGLTNAHSHAFQRAMAGVSEQGAADGDNFWRWRQAMYQVALKIAPEQLRDVAAWLYAELLSQGYTQVCEFHYVHHDAHGSPFSDPAEMSWALMQAAIDTGIGLTLLPTLYQHRGFGREGLEHHQRRFASHPDFVHDVRQSVVSEAKRQGKDGLIGAGVAVHSLRAVHPPGLAELVRGCGEHPIHVHVSEQIQEVADCIEHTGMRPVEWLLSNVGLDERWNLVHATHADAQELTGVAQSKASVVICPVTEANLGDGVFDLVTALDQGLHCSIGTDSHTNRDWAAELRSLEYSLRLTRLARNVASRASTHHRPTAQVLFDLVLEGGSAAAGMPLGGMVVGQRADFFEIDAESGPWVGLPTAHWLDAAVFSTPSCPPKRVYVAGKQQQPDIAAIRARAVRAMKALWQAV